jgi:hypothetical protein
VISSLLYNSGAAKGIDLEKSFLSYLRAAINFASPKSHIFGINCF